MDVGLGVEAYRTQHQPDARHTSWKAAVTYVLPVMLGADVRPATKQIPCVTYCILLCVRCSC